MIMLDIYIAWQCDFARYISDSDVLNHDLVFGRLLFIPYSTKFSRRIISLFLGYAQLKK